MHFLFFFSWKLYLKLSTIFTQNIQTEMPEQKVDLSQTAKEAFWPEFIMFTTEPAVFDTPGSEVIKLFMLTQLSMKFFLLINMKMPTRVGIFIFINREIFMLSYV